MFKAQVILLLYSSYVIYIFAAEEVNITLLPVQAVVFEEETTTFTCKIHNENFDQYSIVWYSNGEIIETSGQHYVSVEHNFTNNIHKLIIKKANAHHAGGYQCKVCFDSLNCTTSLVANVIVYTPPTNPNCETRITDVVEGDIFTFTCWRPRDSKPNSLEIWLNYAMNGQQKYIKRKDLVDITKNLKAEVNITFHLHKATLYCIARFPFPNTTSCASSPLNVSYSPKILSKAITYSIADNTDEASNVSILLNITSNPAATVTWYIYEDKMNESMSYGGCTRDNYYTLYTCFIQNIKIGTVVNIFGENYYGNLNHSITFACDIGEADKHFTTTHYSSTILNDSKSIKNDNNIFILIITITGVIIILITLMICGINRFHKIKRKNRRCFRLDILDELGPSTQAAENTYEMLPTKTNSMTTVVNVNNIHQQACGRSSLRVDRRENDRRSQDGHRSMSNPGSTSSELDKYESKNMLVERAKSANAEKLMYLEIDHSKFENENLRRLQVRTTESVVYDEIVNNN